jgi:hypothetical protein
MAEIIPKFLHDTKFRGLAHLTQGQSRRVAHEGSLSGLQQRCKGARFLKVAHPFS